jgi:membrane associated rhomboid family serine protease
MFWFLPWDDAPVRHLCLATYALIALNIIAFVFSLGLGDGELEALALHADHPRWYQFFTANFLHGDVMHLLGNLAFLLVFGDNVEDAFGPLPYLLLYFLGGFAGDVVFILANPEIAVPTLGASGCIATLAGAYLVMFFGDSIGVRLMFLVFPVTTFHLPGFLVILFWFATDLVRTWWSHGQLDAESGVNYVAHGVGFSVGIALGLVAIFAGVVARYHRAEGGRPLVGYWRPDPKRRKHHSFG